MLLGSRLEALVGASQRSVDHLGGHALSSIGRDAQQVLDHTTDYIAVLHPGGQWVWASQPLLDLIGTTVRYGTTLHSFVNPNDLEAFQSSVALARAKPGEPVDTTLRIWSEPRNRWAVIEGTITSHVHVPGIAGLLLTATDVTRRVEAEAALRRAATRDPLTGLPNRVLLFERLMEASARARRRGESFSVLFLDLDRFKNLNDTLGHAAGDRFLVELARRLRARLRAEDTLVRLGGDEFVIVTGGDDNEEGLANLCDVVLEETASPIEIDGHTVRLGASIGVVRSRGDRDPEGILRDADVAMYEAKRARRGCWVMHEQEMTTRVSNEFRTREHIADIVESGEIGIMFEPIRDWPAGDEVAATAVPVVDLADLQMPVPDAAHAAQTAGLAVSYGALVLRAAIEAALAWSDDRWVVIPVAGGFLADPKAWPTIKNLLGDSGICADRLVLEIGSPATDVADSVLADTVGSLVNAGIRLAVGGFGVDPSALELLGALPASYLKLPEALVRNFVETGNSRIVEAAAAMSVPLGLTVIAEGVDDASVAERLAGHGVHLTQA